MSKNNAICMAILNLTDDSFFQAHNSFAKITDFLSLVKRADPPVSIVDIGAESTAPMNLGLAEEEELGRFKNLLFEILKISQIQKLTLSIDTYRLKTFNFVYSYIKKYYPDFKIIFNDVSGLLDLKLVSLLKKYPEVSYIYCHCLSQSRDRLAEKQMKTVKESLDLYKYFTNGLKFLRNNGVTNEIILDPCFGFSKTYEQNIFILENLSNIINRFPLDQKFLVGVSQKSFLRQKYQTKDPLILKAKELEYFSSLIQKSNRHRIILRTHLF